MLLYLGRTLLFGYKLLEVLALALRRPGLPSCHLLLQLLRLVLVDVREVDISVILSTLLQVT